MKTTYVPISDNLTTKLQGIGRDLDGIIGKALDYKSTDLENEMKNSAPWSDRTTNARSGLRCTYAKGRAGEHALVLYHTMPYGVYLETRWNAKYAVIMPTIQKKTPEVMNFMGEIFRRLEGTLR